MKKITASISADMNLLAKFDATAGLEINPQFRVFVNDFQYYRACVTGWLSQIPMLLMEMCDYVLSPAKFPAFILTRFR